MNEVDVNYRISGAMGKFWKNFFSKKKRLKLMDIEVSLQIRDSIKQNIDKLGDLSSKESKLLEKGCDL